MKTNLYLIILLFLVGLGCQKKDVTAIAPDELGDSLPETTWDGRYIYTATAPTIIASATKVLSTGADFVDAPLSSWTVGSTRYWLHSDNWGDYHQKMTGPVDNPLQTKVFEKNRSAFFSNNSEINGKPWVMSVYKDSLGGLLAFLHMEFVTAGGSDNKGRIALAYSTNNGDTFKYLGEIIAPYGDPDMTGGFLQGAPYLVKDGYFYCYYNEANTNVARASVAEVITAARNDTTSPWKKYYNGTFTEDGMFGNRSAIMASHGGAVEGICHTQAAYSTYDNKYYLVMTSMNWAGINTYVKLWQSADGINWRLYKVLANQPAAGYPANSGWQYASIIADGLGDNAVVGQRFHVICGNRPTEPASMSLQKWVVDLSDGPIGYWNLDQSAYDLSGPNNGVLSGGASYVTGKRNHALNFDGVDGYLEISNSGGSLASMNALTVSFWVNLAELPVQYVSLLGVEIGADAYRVVVDNTGKGHFVIATTNNGWYSNGTLASWDTPLSLSSWYHIAGTYDGDRVRVYINGEEKGIGAAAISGPIIPSSNPLRSGYPTSPGLSYLKGKMDEIRIYPKALNATEITSLYQFESL